MNECAIIILIISYNKMGCTQSAVVQNTHKLKPLSSQIQGSHNHLLFGQISQNKYVSYTLEITQQKSQPLVIKQRQLPISNSNSKIKLPNFSQLVRIGTSNLYFLTGGISYKLDTIYSQCYLYNNKTNKIHELPKCNYARYTHSSVFYKNRLYITGGRYFGQDDKAILNKCQYLEFGKNVDELKNDEDVEKVVIEASKNGWKLMPDMNIKRCSHLTIIYNKCLYILGGYTGEYQRSPLIQYINLGSLKKWETLKVCLPFGIESATALATGQPNQFIIFGGNSNTGPMDTILQINLLSGYESVLSKGKLKSKKILHKMVRQKQKVYLLGGNQRMQIQVYQDAFIQDKKNNGKNIYKNILQNYFSSQQQLQSLTQSTSSLEISSNSSPPSQHSSKSATDQIAYIFGTNTQPFILQLNISVPYALCHSVPLSIKMFALQGVIYLKQSDQYFIFGGISDSQEEVNAECFVYCPSDWKKCRAVGRMVTSRYAFGCRRVGNWVYAIGGGTSDQQGQLMLINKCQRINIKQLQKSAPSDTVTWSQICALPIGLISPMTLTNKNKLYIFGGMQQNKERYRNILRYNENTNIWQQIKYKFTYGLQASSIYHKKQDQYYIFGGRVINGDTQNIWKLSFIQDGNDCVFQEIGKMNESKCLHNVYKPKFQDFIIVLGGQKQVLSFYDQKSLKPIESDILSGLKELFVYSLATLSDKSLKNYTMAIKQ